MAVRSRVTYRLEPLSDTDIARWDELVRPYPSCELFHQTPWLEYLVASRGVTLRYWSLSQNGAIIGYFCGGVLRKGPFKILGSPLRGWGTNFMGPVTDIDLDTEAFIEALDRLARHEGFAMVELESRLLSPPAMVEAGYVGDRTLTFVITLSPQNDEKALWERMDGTRRSGVRKAIKNGLIVEDLDDSSVADDFYDQYEEVMRRKGLRPPYDRIVPRLLFQHLRKADQLIALRVREPAGRVVATGLFPHDDRTMYFWGGASTQEGYELSANEFMQWNAIQMAARKGLSAYDMCGNGLFKKKFGGELLELNRWTHYYSSAARWGRATYAFILRHRLHLPKMFAPGADSQG